MTTPPHGRINVTSEVKGYYRAVIENPPLNLADPEFFYDLRWLIDTLDADDEARVVVFESATPDYFLAHFDLVTGQDADRDAAGPTGLPLWPDLSTRLARRIASWDRPALELAKSLVNHSSSLPPGRDLVASQEAFFGTFAWEATQQRIGRVFELGFQQPGDTELRLGDVVGELGQAVA